MYRDAFTVLAAKSFGPVSWSWHQRQKVATKIEMGGQLLLGLPILSHLHVDPTYEILQETKSPLLKHGYHFNKSCSIFLWEQYIEL